MTEILIPEHDSSGIISGRPLLIDRMVMGGVLLSLLTKIHLFFVGFRIYQLLPLHDEFFPHFFQDAWVFLIVYVAVLSLATASLMIHGRTVGLYVRCAMLVGIFLLCIHQQTYNDVTFVTCFWTVGWSSWFVWEAGRRGEGELLEMATTFSHLVLSLIFLGGAIGKMTPGYWNGEVIYGIYFESRNFWCFNWIRGMVAAENLREWAMGYSRMIVTMEWTCAFLWLMPPRVASVLAFLTLFGIAFFSNFLLLSVVGCLLGLALVGLLARPSAEVSGSV